MKKIIIGFILGIVLSTAGIVIAKNVGPDIEGGDRDGLIPIASSTDVKRFYDKDYNLVCWVAENIRWSNAAPAISCVKVDK